MVLASPGGAGPVIPGLLIGVLVTGLWVGMVLFLMSRDL